MLTKMRPLIREVGSTGLEDAYAVPGDPIAFYPICDWFRAEVLGVPQLQILESHKCAIEGKPIGNPWREIQ